MHFLIGLGLLSVLVGFVLGENAARVFVGAVLAVVAIVFGFITIAAMRGAI